MTDKLQSVLLRYVVRFQMETSQHHNNVDFRLVVAWQKGKFCQNWSAYLHR